jgi:putative hydrolase of the HAD superfamily
MVRVIAFDADDTLWHSQRGFDQVEAEFQKLLADFAEPDRLHRELYAVEVANMAAFGYGVKAFTLSLIETALKVSGGAVATRDLQRILDAGKALLQEPVELLDGAVEAVEGVADDHRLLLVTKGDLLHQERKLAESGLAGYFDRVDIVSEKDEATYARVLDEEDVDPADFLMVGNSLRSDVLPVIDLGGWAVHVPYETTWVHERVNGDEPGIPHAFTIGSLAELPSVVGNLLEG